jgi:EmrB/QacA subfamily drug resistance transporter
LRPVAGNVSARRHWTLAAMTAGLTLVFLDQTAVSVALPSIAKDTGATQTELAWVVNAFLLPLAALAAVAARLGDLYGRPRVLAAGIGLFAAGSLACGLAPSEDALIAARVVQGVGAAAMMPLTTAIVADTFGPAERGRALGIYIGVASAFLSVGPLVGGLLSDLASWRWIFFVNLPVAAFAIAIIRRYVPAGPRAPQPEGFDVIGSVLLAGGVGSIALGLLEGHAWGWASAAVPAVLGAGVVLLSAFAAVESRRRQPLIPLSLLADRVFLGAVLAVLCTRFVTVGALVLSAIYLQQELGLRPLTAGLALLPATVPMLLVAPAGGWATDRFGPRGGTTIGIALAGASVLALALLAPDGRYAELWPAFVVFGAGIGLVTVTTSTAGMDVAGASERGEAAGILTTTRQIGATFGLAAMSAVFVAVETAHAGRPMVGDGLRVALLLGAGVCAATGVATFVLLRGPGPASRLRARAADPRPPPPA